MKSSRYDLHTKVPGRSKPFYVVRRRTIDGGYECSCPAWVEARQECRHVRPIREALRYVHRLDPIGKAIEDAINHHPYYIQDCTGLIQKIEESIRKVTLSELP